MNCDNNLIIKSLTDDYLKNHRICGLKEYFKNKHIDLYNYIFEFTKSLNSTKYPFSHLLYWVVNNIIEFPKCPICGDANKRVIKFSIGYSGTFKFCSHKCAVSSKSCSDQRKSTNLERYGTKTPAENREIMNKIKSTNRDRYGSDCYLSSDIGKDNINRIMNDRYGVNHNSQLLSVKNKLSKSWSNRTADQIQDIVLKSKDTKLHRYNDENYNNRDQAVKTNIERYGVSNPQNSRRDSIKNNRNQ